MITIDLNDLSPWGLHKVNNHNKNQFLVTREGLENIKISTDKNIVSIDNETLRLWAIDTIFKKQFRYLYIETRSEQPIYIGFNEHHLAAELLKTNETIYYNPLLEVLNE